MEAKAAAVHNHRLLQLSLLHKVLSLQISPTLVTPLQGTRSHLRFLGIILFLIFPQFPWLNLAYFIKIQSIFAVVWYWDFGLRGGEWKCQLRAGTEDTLGPGQLVRTSWFTLYKWRMHSHKSHLSYVVSRESGDLVVVAGDRGCSQRV